MNHTVYCSARTIAAHLSTASAEAQETGCEFFLSLFVTGNFSKLVWTLRNVPEQRGPGRGKASLKDTPPKDLAVRKLWWDIACQGAIHGKCKAIGYSIIATVIGVCD